MTIARNLDGMREYETPDKAISAGTVLATIVLGEVFFPGVLGWFIEQANSDLIGLVRVSVDEILLIGAMVVVHEGIHYTVAAWLGYSPKAGVKFFETPWRIKEPSPYVVVLNELIPRNDNIAMLIAPLLVINAFAFVGILSSFSPIVGHYAAVILVVNTGASLSDVYNVSRVIRLDSGTEFINIEDDGIQTFYDEP